MTKTEFQALPEFQADLKPGALFQLLPADDLSKPLVGVTLIGYKARWFEVVVIEDD